jgi:uncharacterized repeat protein (TIGR03837 family)
MKTVDVFCRVVDNLGDAGVSWRLCRTLALEKKVAVRLFIDDPETLRRFVLEPSADHALLDSGQIVLIHTRQDPLPSVPGDLVIETFGCDVPAPYSQRMATRQPQSRWVNLEYLSAEDWVEDCHGLPSPHPVLPITRWFFFPGFSAKTGGLLKESDLEMRRDQALMRPRAPTLTVSLLSYDHKTLEDLLDAWESSPEPVHCRVFQGPQVARVHAWAEARQLKRLTLEMLPWMTQEALDDVLFTSDFTVVRGEDSFVRAQWARRPFLWDIYPTDDGAHLVKMAAFLRRYREGMSEPLRREMGELWQAWVRREGTSLPLVWKRLRPLLPEWQRHAEEWADRKLPQKGLVDQLWDFLKTH